LAASEAENKIQLGVNLTEGLGAGSKPEIGEAAAEEAIEEIRGHIKECHMVFVAAGMGGGTGTGAAGVIARVAHEMEILTVGVVTKPFHFEGNRRMRAAEMGIAELAKHVDTLIAIPNQNLFRIANEQTTFAKAFEMADQVLHAGISCVTDLIIREGLINLDFADVRAIMLDMGAAMMGTGEASGERRAIEAAELAIANPLLDDVTLKGARGLLVSISGSSDLTLYEVDEAANRIRDEVDPEANIIVGANFDADLGDKVRVSIVASGLRGQPVQTMPQPAVDATQMIPVHPPQVSAPSAPAGQPAAPPQHAAMRPAHPAPPPPAQPADNPQPNRMVQAARSAPATRGAPPQPQSQGDVRIEVGPPRMLTSGTLAQPAPAARKVEADMTAQAAFMPAAPQTVRRAPPRMPEIEDFPPIAQRKLREKNESEAAPKPPRKRSRLFDRLKGGSAGKTGEKSIEPAQDPLPLENTGDDPFNPEQEIEIPGFFKRKMRR
ncbi:MAG: cell division protein FtsZ, partial [Hyphomicrobiaceae bacterium]